MRLTRYLTAAFFTLLGFAGAAQASVPRDWQMGMLEAASPQKAQMHYFHNLLLVIITAIVVVVMLLLAYVMWRFSAKRNPVPSKTSHNTLLEVVWTVVPVLILLVIAVPSLRLLYYLDRTEDPEMTLIVQGYQWYWGYEYPDQQIPEFMSFMLHDDELEEHHVRLLSTDQPVVLPVDTNIQLLITASDVIHSWAVPSFGIKMDGIPGRMNETWVRIDREGVYYGMCSEICGVNHGFMPIEVHAVSREAYDEWVIEQTAHLDIDPQNPPILLTRSYQDAIAERNQLAAVEESLADAR